MWVRAGALQVDRVQHPHYGPRQPGAHLWVLWGKNQANAAAAKPEQSVNSSGFFGSFQEDLSEHVVQGDTHPGHVGTACLLSSSFLENGKDHGVATLPIMSRSSRQTLGKVRGKIGNEEVRLVSFTVKLHIWPRVHGTPVIKHIWWLFSVDYLVIRPIQRLQCDMSSSFTKYWRKRSALNVGHRGAGSTHAAKWVTTLFTNNLLLTCYSTVLCL